MNDPYQHIADALVKFATVTEVHERYALVKVDDLGKTTGWLPVLQQANDVKRCYNPIALGEQVVVLGNRCVLRSVYHSQKEPIGSGGKVDITEYNDGTRIEYDTDNKVLTVDAVGTVNITASTININGDSGDVIVNGISLVDHTHQQNDGNHHGGGVNTGKAQQ